MLLLGAILLAIFVLPSPWGIVAVAAGGFLDVAESLILLRWSRRRRAVTGGEALIGQADVVSKATHVRLAGVGEAFREGHRDAGPEGCRKARNERVVRLVGDDRDGEDRRQGRQRAVDEPDHSRLNSLQQEGFAIGH